MRIGHVCRVAETKRVMVEPRWAMGAQWWWPSSHSEDDGCILEKSEVLSSFVVTAKSVVFRTVVWLLCGEQVEDGEDWRRSNTGEEGQGMGRFGQCLRG